MCIALVAINHSDRFPLIVLNNRDEFFERPSHPANRKEGGRIFGLDEQSGGTWLGLNERTGEIAFLTHYRDPRMYRDDRPRSRGDLVERSFDAGFERGFFTSIDREEYDPFNLVRANKIGFFYYNSVEGRLDFVDGGTHVVSNAFLNTPWPKTVRLKELFLNVDPTLAFENMVEQFFNILRDASLARDEDLPDTHIPRHVESAISSIFVSTPIYGTRCSTVVMQDREGKIFFLERTYDQKGIKSLDVSYVSYLH